MDAHRPGKRLMSRRLIFLAATLAGLSIFLASPAGADDRPPTQTLFAPGTQDVDRLHILIQVHERGTLAVSATVNVRGRSYRSRRVTRSVPPHITNTVRLKFASGKLRALKRALRRTRAKANVTSTATDRVGNRRSYRRSIRLRD